MFKILAHAKILCRLTGKWLSDFFTTSSSLKLVIAFQHLLQKLNKVLPNKGTNWSVLAGKDNVNFIGCCSHASHVTLLLLMPLMLLVIHYFKKCRRK